MTITWKSKDSKNMLVKSTLSQMAASEAKQLERSKFIDGKGARLNFHFEIDKILTSW